MQEFLNTPLAGSPLSGWLLASAFLIGALVVSRLFLFLTNKKIKPVLEKLKGRFLFLLIDMIEEPLSVIIILFGFRLGLPYLRVSQEILTNLGTIEHVLLVLLATWAIARLADMLISSYIKPLVEQSQSELDDQLLPIVATMSRVVIWLLGGILALDNAGYDVGALLAGLGIGGLAFALAAQDTIANLFGGITIFTDNPFKINDRIKVAGVDGFVREIGIRVSRLETLEGRKVTMPNSMLSKNYIENVSSEPNLKVVLSMYLPYGTEAEKVQEAVSILQDILLTSPGLDGKPLALLNDFTPLGIQLQMIYFIAKSSVVPEVKTAVHLEVLRRFSQAGISMLNPGTVKLP